MQGASSKESQKRNPEKLRTAFPPSLDASYKPFGFKSSQIASPLPSKIILNFVNKYGPSF